MKNTTLIAPALLALSGCVIGPPPMAEHPAPAGGVTQAAWLEEEPHAPDATHSRCCPPVADDACAPPCGVGGACPACPICLDCPLKAPVQSLAGAPDPGPPGRFFPVPVRPVFSPTYYGPPPELAAPCQ